MERAPTQCILCGSEEWLPLFAQNGWRVVRCAACGLGVLDPRPTPAELAELYGQEYFETNLMESGAPGSPGRRPSWASSTATYGEARLYHGSCGT